MEPYVRRSYEDDAEAYFEPDSPHPSVLEWGGPVDAQPGPRGLCWENARRVAGANPDELLYAEGFAWNQGERTMHGWVVRRSDFKVIECTAGYESSVGYRGVCFEVGEVEAFIDARPLVGGATCRDRWRTFAEDGSVESEAPGVFAILAEERGSVDRDQTELWREMESWIKRGVLPT